MGGDRIQSPTGARQREHLIQSWLVWNGGKDGMPQDLNSTLGRLRLWDRSGSPGRHGATEVRGTISTTLRRQEQKRLAQRRESVWGEGTQGYGKGGSSGQGGILIMEILSKMNKTSLMSLSPLLSHKILCNIYLQCFEDSYQKKILFLKNNGRCSILTSIPSSPFSLKAIHVGSFRRR